MTEAQLTNELVQLRQQISELEKTEAEQKQADAARYKVTRAVRVLSECNEALVRATNESELLCEICRIIVESGGYCMAWVGFAEQDEKKTVRPAAWAGCEESYLETVDITWANAERGRGPTGTAIRTGTPSVARYIPTDRSFEPWRAEAIKRGYASSVALPLIYWRILGALNIYAAQPDAFDPEEVELLARLADDLAYGITALRTAAEHKQMETELRQSAEEWQATFDAIPDLVSVQDKDFKICKVNKVYAQFFNMKPEEIIGRTCYQVFHGTNEPRVRCPFRKVLKTGRPAITEFLEPRFGTYLQVSVSPIFDEKGEVVRCVHFVKDITESKKMEEQLMTTDRLASLGELVSGIAHELNNPLTSIIGFADLLLEREIPDDIIEDVKAINREAERTAKIVRNVLTFARKQPQEKQPVDINQLIQAVLELRAYEQRVNNIQVNTRFAKNHPKIMGNSFQLQQVFLNIIINAEYFMTEAHGKGTITIATQRLKDVVQASFADDGPGISKENLQHIFDPFFTTKEAGKGTGLGLSICHGIVTEHGGRIYAESELGKGATFVVELSIS